MRIHLAILLSAAVAGCGGGEFEDIDQFMAEKRARPGGVVTPVPPFKAYEAFAYNAATLRSPFDRPAEIRETMRPRSLSAVEPDGERPKELLERFALDSLSMVGTLSRADVDWSLVRDPGGGVHRVREGNYLGSNHGRIVEMAGTYIAVVEIVSDGSGGWVERPRTIRLGGLD